MLFVKLLLSPMPHARVARIDTSAALAMPGVKAILTADDLPAPADIVTDLGQTIRANPKGERALTNEPVYEGEPILAVAAVDEYTAAEAIEAIQIEYEPLPFVVDPLVTLRPGGPNARVEGNYLGPSAGAAGAGWWSRRAAAARRCDGAEVDARPTSPNTTRASCRWASRSTNGRTAISRPASKRPLSCSTSRSRRRTTITRCWSRAPRWRTGRTASCSCTPGRRAPCRRWRRSQRWLSLEPENIVLITPYTGGGFGSRATGAISCVIPALIAKKTGTPVMMRITREEDHYIGGIRPAVHGRMKAGFGKDGRLLALDMFVIAENSAYEASGDGGQASRIVSLAYQPVAMRARTVTVLTNTPPRRAQSQPGGLQGHMLFEPVIAKAARQLGIDQVAIRRLNSPEGKAPVGPPNARGQRPYCTSAFIKQALDKGAEIFRWDERKAQSGQRVGSKVRGVGVAVSTFVAGSTGFDGLFVIKPDGKMYIQSGIGNLGTESFSDTQRVAAEMMGMPWEQVVVSWGDTSQPLPWSCVSGGSQTTHAHTRAAHAAAADGIKKVQEIAAKTLGGSPDSYKLADGKVSGNGRSMTFAQVAQKAIELGGKYDGHELPKDINRYTITSATALAGQGLMGVARDNYPRDGSSYSFVAGFAEVEVDVETGNYQMLDYLAVADVGTVIHPRSLGGQILGRSVLGMGHSLAQKMVYDQHYGVPLAKRFYQNRPPTILDVPAAQGMKWVALDIPDPETPVGARGIGEPPVAAGACAVMNAISAAVGDEIFRRAPVTLDAILTSLEAGHPVTETLTANI